MDYHKLLVAYIGHVLKHEGVDFLIYDIAGLSDEEIAALRLVGEEASEPVKDSVSEE